MSIVIPAHDEERTIGPCIERILAAAKPDEVEVIVVANGCTDHTADVARAFGPPVRVIELEVGHKPSALNAAIDEVRTHPVVFLDADVDVTLEALRACVRTIEEGAMATAPRLVVRTDHASRGVQRFYRVWMRMPWVTQDLVGSGVFMVSEEGLDRLGRFPDEGADDLWVSERFVRGERVTTSDHTFAVRSSHSLPQLIRRRSRIIAANRLVRRRSASMPGRVDAESRAMFELVRSRQAPMLDVLVYASVKAAARVRAEVMVTRGTVEWHGDDRALTHDDASHDPAGG